MASMRFSTRIAQATDEQESNRYALQGTLVTPEGFAVATNGRLIACVQAQVDGLTHAAMVPQELGPKSKADLKAEFHTNGQSLRCEKHSTVRKQRHIDSADVQAGRFPQVGYCLDKVDTQRGLVLAINAHFLWRLAQAINVPDTNAAETVTLLIPLPPEGEVVTEAIGAVES